MDSGGGSSAGFTREARAAGLGPGDPPPVQVSNPAGRARALVVCDHAAPRVPIGLGRMGLPAERLTEHIAYDLGAAALARALSRRLDAPLVSSAYSRLVIDVNRWPDSPELIPEESDRVVVPGNRGFDAGEREARRREIFWPYQRQIGRMLDAIEARGAGLPLLVAVHSFTPSMNGKARPWHVGVLSGCDRRVAEPLLARLRARGHLVVGDNEPYSGLDLVGFTTLLHGEGRALPHALLEVRQDLLAADQGVECWCGILGTALEDAFEDHWR